MSIRSRCDRVGWLTNKVAVAVTMNATIAVTTKGSATGAIKVGAP